MEESGGPIRGALARLRSAPLWVWITVLLTFGLLIFAYLQYRKSGSSTSTDTTGNSSSAGLGTVPDAGVGQPNWATADQGAFVAGNVTDVAALLAYLKSNQTPNPTPTATPTPPGGPPAGASNPYTDSSGATYFKITQRYSPQTAGTTTIQGLANRYHTSVASLLKLNPQVSPSSKTTYVGEWIRVK